VAYYTEEQVLAASQRVYDAGLKVSGRNIREELGGEPEERNHYDVMMSLLEKGRWPFPVHRTPKRVSWGMSKAGKIAQSSKQASLNTDLEIARALVRVRKAIANLSPNVAREVIEMAQLWADRNAR
jgi:hypothetical protein